MKDIDLIVQLKLSLQRALLSAVSVNLFAVTAGIDNKLIRIDAYFIKDVSKEEKELIEIVTTEVIADFPAEFKVEEFCFSITERKLQMLDFWVFMRKDESNNF